jgi:hypothetical protein
MDTLDLHRSLLFFAGGSYDAEDTKKKNRPLDQKSFGKEFHKKPPKKQTTPPA